MNRDTESITQAYSYFQYGQLGIIACLFLVNIVET